MKCFPTKADVLKVCFDSGWEDNFNVNLEISQKVKNAKFYSTPESTAVQRRYFVRNVKFYCTPEFYIIRKGVSLEILCFVVPQKVQHLQKDSF